MHGLNRALSRPLAPPLAKRRPKFSAHHGVELVDEYAWLRAENWQEVMRDPSVLEGDIRDRQRAAARVKDARPTQILRKTPTTTPRSIVGLKSTARTRIGAKR